MLRKSPIVEEMKEELIQKMVGGVNTTKITLNGENIEALIDSGSQVSTITEKLYNNLKRKPDLHQMEDFQLQLRSANGGIIPYTGYIHTEIEVSMMFEPISVILLVVPLEYSGKTNVLIGTNVIREIRNKSNIQENTEEAWKTAFISMTSEIGNVTATKDILLKPNETRTVTGFLRKKSTEARSAVTENIEGSNNSVLICPRVVELGTSGKNARIPVKIYNVTAKPIRIRAKEELCRLEEVKVLREADVCKTEEKHTTEELRKGQSQQETRDIKETYGVNIEERNLTETQKQKVTILFNKYHRIFPKTPTDLGHTGQVKHKINLMDGNPFKEKYRPVPPGIYNEVREHLKEMIDIGAIRNSSSPWSSNVVIVRKKDGQIRFCIDFRKLNQRTKKDSYGIPRVEDTLHMLSGSKYFSKLDLKSGYWQVELAEEDKEKTAFQVGGLGFFECNRMPFGLCNAPATFQRLMERCMGDMNLRDCLIYLDDIIIFSRDIDSHLERLDAVFSRLASFNLKINPSKCEFFKTSTTYLGHVISEQGIQADPQKIEAVKNWPVPKTVKDVRKFLGFAGYYRRFVKGFATIARPLSDLLIGHPTKKSGTPARKHVKRTPFVWEDRQQTAFEKLKTMLTKPPILAYADYTKSFILHTDASSKGLGAVLYQNHDGIEHVVAYASRSLRQAERNYPAHKLEFLALKWSVTEKFHDYLYGAEFEVVTDNNPLTYVTTTAKLDATGQRWMAALAGYNFSLRYRAGRNNADADGLSRLDMNTFLAVHESISACVEETPLCYAAVQPDAISEADPIEQVSVPEPLIQGYALSSRDWRTAQLNDPIISVLHNHIHDGTRPSVQRGMGQISDVGRYIRDWDKLQLRDGVLYRKASVGSLDCLQMLLPVELRDEVFTALHDDLGHQGRDRTVSLFKQRFYWPGMEKFVRVKVSACPRCIRRKSPSQTAELVNISTSAPMEMVCLDYLSLERSKGGFENILVVTDHFSRYAQAFPTTNQTARTTAKVLFEKFFVHYGFPERIHSDKGANFMSGLIEELCRLAGMDQSRTTPYHAMGNGMVERFNQTLIQMMGTLDEEKKSDWKTHVAPMVHAYNATVHCSTGYAPYYLMFGRHPRLPIDVFLGLPVGDVDRKFKNEYTRKLRHRLATAYRRAQESAKKTSEINKRHYDRKAHATKILPGDLVLVRNVTLRGKQKIADRWENEPYQVLDQPNPDVPVFDVRIADKRSRRIRRLHRNLLLPLGVTSPVATPEARYVIPQRRRQTQDVADDAPSVNHQLRRSRRLRNKPAWQTSGQYV